MLREGQKEFRDDLAQEGRAGLETSPEGTEGWTGRGHCRSRSLPLEFGKGAWAVG